MKRGIAGYSLIIVFCLAFLIFGMVRNRRVRDAAPDPTRTAPPFLLTDSQGRSVANRDLIGRKIGLLFFRADCDYCIDELKQLNELAPGYEGDFILLLVSLSDKETTEHIKNLLGLLSECHTASPDTLSRFNVRSVPLLLLIDGRGEISYTQLGMRKLSFQKLVLERFIRGESLTDQSLRSVYQP